MFDSGLQGFLALPGRVDIQTALAVVRVVTASGRNLMR